MHRSSSFTRQPFHCLSHCFLSYHFSYDLLFFYISVCLISSLYHFFCIHLFSPVILFTFNYMLLVFVIFIFIWLLRSSTAASLNEKIFERQFKLPNVNLIESYSQQQRQQTAHIETGWKGYYVGRQCKFKFDVQCYFAGFVRMKQADNHGV